MQILWHRQKIGGNTPPPLFCRTPLNAFAPFVGLAVWLISRVFMDERAFNLIINDGRRPGHIKSPFIMAKACEINKQVDQPGGPTFWPKSQHYPLPPKVRCLSLLFLLFVFFFICFVFARPKQPAARVCMQTSSKSRYKCSLIQIDSNRDAFINLSATPRTAFLLAANYLLMSLAAKSAAGCSHNCMINGRIPGVSMKSRESQNRTLVLWQTIVFMALFTIHR